MNPFSAPALGFAWLGIGGISWLGWQLLRQNGRILVRLGELEKRLDAVEFGEGDQPTGLAVGTEAPAFELPDLASNTRRLAEFRGRPLLLIFFNPACGFCREMVPKLAALYGVRRQAQRDAALDVGGRSDDSSESAVVAGALQNGVVSLPLVLIISTGDAEANRQIFDEHKLTVPVLLQGGMEVAAAYKANGTPSGYLIDAAGKIASGLAIGADALLEIATTPRISPGDQPQASASNGHGEDQSLVTASPTSRFGNRSLGKSKIKRDGLKAGTPAPDFRLPRLDGRGELSLSEFHGQRVLLVFSSPNCDPCNALGPELEKFYRANCARQQTVNALSSSGGERRGEEGACIHVIMISKGDPKENRAKVKEHGLTFRIVLQQQWEISRRYAMFATPVAYLIDEQGVIVHDVSVGTDAIQNLLHDCSLSAEKVLVS